MIAAVRRVTGEEPLTQVASLPGTPDVLVPRHRLAIFAMGCFWHHHGPGCLLSRVPETAYDWRRKFARNARRDRENREALIAQGYRVTWVWECALRGPEALPEAELDSLLTYLISSPIDFAVLEGRGVRQRQANHARGTVPAHALRA